MILIYIQTITTPKIKEVPIRILLVNIDGSTNILDYLIRPSIAISKKKYDSNNLDRLEFLSAVPFCDVADELIEKLQGKQLIFYDKSQYYSLKFQFSTVGFNFSITPQFVLTKAFVTTMEGGYIARKFANAKKHKSLEFSKQLLIETTHVLNLKLNAKNCIEKNQLDIRFDLSGVSSQPGIYFFLNQANDIIYVGKAKNIKRRLQSHFTQNVSLTNINYSEVTSFNVEYSGNDLIAQLMESYYIKTFKPIYNTQQIIDAKPFFINQTKTAKGIHKLGVSRKVFEDNLPEKFFNRASVKLSLMAFCDENKLCRKHCGIEKVKGPCSVVTRDAMPCVCSGEESISNYNKRVKFALDKNDQNKTHKIYKLRGRNDDEDAFIYLIDGIYQGFGFINKNEPVSNVHDVLAHLVQQPNNYDTARILFQINKQISAERIIELSSLQ